VLKNLAGTRGSPPTQQISKIKVGITRLFGERCSPELNRL